MYKTVTGMLAALAIGGAGAAWAADAAHKSVADLYQQGSRLAGKTVQIEGKVTRVNNAIMHRNFLHVSDGTGGDGKDQVTVTTQDSAEVGDHVVVTGTLAVNRDFGSGYTYPIIIEKAKVDKVR